MKLKFDAKPFRCEPFSRFGSYMAFAITPPAWGHKGLVLRSLFARGIGPLETFRLAIIRDGREVDYRIDATATLCRLTPKKGGGKVEIVFDGTEAARIRGEDVKLRLVSILDKKQYAMQAGGGRWHVNCPASNTQYLLVPLVGQLEMDALFPLHNKTPGDELKRPRVLADFLPDCSGNFEAVIHAFVTTPLKLEFKDSFDDCAKKAEKEWQKWVMGMPSVPPRYADAARQAMYVNWSAAVRPFGNYRRDTLLMSKNWMVDCWSWDHCFNAMALAYHNPDLAWDQLQVHFDLQDEFGALPDGVNANKMGWGFCKPPIHGWALSMMMKANKKILTAGRLAKFYPKLVNWTNWWLNDRDYDCDGLPEYHHGQDSGWDNATVYDIGFPMTAPDLPACLVLQMDMLSEMAGRLGKKKQAKEWKSQADAMLERMIEKLWTGKQFVSRQAFTGRANEQGDCLQNYIPIILGKRLPVEIRDCMAAALKPGGRFVTKYGPASESPKSPLYVPNSYWRGPIWAPDTLQIVDGLWRAGCKDLASTIARAFCDLCLRAGVFAENFDALTGQPLCDPAYTWTSSTFLILAHEYLKD